MSYFYLWYDYAFFENTRIMNLLKMQIPFMRVFSMIMHKISLATIGVCVFYASASVGAFFIDRKWELE